LHGFGEGDKVTDFNSSSVACTPLYSAVSLQSAFHTII